MQMLQLLPSVDMGGSLLPKEDTFMANTRICSTGWSVLMSIVSQSNISSDHKAAEQHDIWSSWSCDSAHAEMCLMAKQVFPEMMMST